MSSLGLCHVPLGARPVSCVLWVWRWPRSHGWSRQHRPAPARGAAERSFPLLGNAFGGSHSDPAVRGPATNSPWWRHLSFVHSLCWFPHPQGRRGIADPSGAVQSARESGMWDEGCLGLLQGWHQHPVPASRWGCSAEQHFVIFYFSNKGWEIMKLSPFDGMKP